MSNPSYYQYRPVPERTIRHPTIFYTQDSSIEEMNNDVEAEPLHGSTVEDATTLSSKRGKRFVGFKAGLVTLTCGVVVVSLACRTSFSSRPINKKNTFRPAQRFNDVISEEWLEENTEAKLQGKDEAALLRHSFSLREMFLGDEASTQTLESSSLVSSNIYLNDTKAYSMFSESSGYNLDFFSIVPGWDAQMNQRYCGVATSVAILNSLRTSDHGEGVDLPLDRQYKPYHYATQHDVFGACTNKHVMLENRDEDGSVKFDAIDHWPVGTSLRQVGGILRCHLDGEKWKVTVVEVDPEKISPEEVKRILVDALANENARALINYGRRELLQAGGGHFSPLGAYHPPSDSFLIMDVAKYKYPPVWAKAELLYASMASADTCGIWNWPNAQMDLGDLGVVDFSKLSSLTKADVERIHNILGCQQTHRGFVVVEKID